MYIEFVGFAVNNAMKRTKPISSSSNNNKIKYTQTGHYTQRSSSFIVDSTTESNQNNIRETTKKTATTTTTKGIIIVRILTLIHRLCMWMKFVAGFPQAHAHAHTHNSTDCVCVCVMCIIANQRLSCYKALLLPQIHYLLGYRVVGTHSMR